MASIQRRWLHKSLAVAAILCSVVSLFALFELNAPRWISPLNALAVVFALLAVKTRGRGTDSNNG